MNNQNIRMVEIRDLEYSNSVEGKLSPSREHSKFRELYGHVNRPYLHGSNDFESFCYNNDSNGSGVA